MITRRKLLEMIPPVAAAVALPAAAVGLPVVGAATISGEVVVGQPHPWLGDVIFANERAYIWIGDRWISEQQFINRDGDHLVLPEKTKSIAELGYSLGGKK